MKGDGIGSNAFLDLSINLCYPHNLHLRLNVMSVETRHGQPNQDLIHTITMCQAKQQAITTYTEKLELNFPLNLISCD